jgi:hypothetical protein
MAGSAGKPGSGWVVLPLVLFFVGAMLTSVVSHGVTGSTHTTVMIGGFVLDAIALVWGVARWRKASNGE